MAKYITKKQYLDLKKIPRDRMATRAKVYCGTIVEAKGKILMVLEDDQKFSGYDLPGGKLLWGENVKDCAIREYVEETGFSVNLSKVVGIYQRKNVDDEADYFRIIFAGKINLKKARKDVDESVKNIQWIAVEDILNRKIALRSREVSREIEDFVNKRMVGIEILGDYEW